MIETAANSANIIILIGAIAVLAYQEYMHRKEMKKRIDIALEQAANICRKSKFTKPESELDTGFNEGCDFCAKQIDQFNAKA